MKDSRIRCPNESAYNKFLWEGDAVELKGFVSAKYLDRNWYQSFTVTATKKKETDIPVLVVIENNAYKAAQFSNDMPTYHDLMSENYALKHKIQELERSIKSEDGHGR